MSRRAGRLAFCGALALLICACAEAVPQVAGSASRPKTAQAGGGSARTVVMAQVVPPPGGPPTRVVATGGVILGEPGEADVVRNEPYQAEAVTEIQQTLADGTHINQRIAASVARDNEGRTVRSQELSGNGPFVTFRVAGNVPLGRPSAATALPPTLTTIFDPIAKERIDYTSDVMVAHVMPMDGSPRIRTLGAFGHQESGRVIAFAGGDGPGAVAVSDGGEGPMVDQFMAGSDPKDTKTEALGEKMLDGLKATGTRRIWTIPAGAIGNDRAIVTTEETWYSPRLKVVLLSIRDDPRFGKTTYTLKDLKLANPSSSLFRIPHGYAVEELPAPPPMPAPPVHAPFK